MKININTLILVIINCCLLVFGQILWKIGLRQVELNSLKSVILSVFNANIFTGLIIYVIATFIWFYILKKNDLSKVYPLQSISYVLALVFGRLILNESITKGSVIGTILICAGIFAITK